MKKFRKISKNLKQNNFKMPLIDGYNFSDKLEDYFEDYFEDSEKVLVYLYRIQKVLGKCYLSIITVYDDTNDTFSTAHADIKTILLPFRPNCAFPELDSFFEGTQVHKIRKQWEEDYWNDIILDYRVFRTLKDFNAILNANCSRANNLEANQRVCVEAE
jgi:hypothetical protein